MPSRQDQLHSYQFTVQRAVTALVMRETDPATSPFRRSAGAALASVLVAVIVLGGAALYGLFAGGGSGWRNEQAVIVEKESGARFVYRDDKLHPVSNYASALLIIGAERAKTVLVSRRSIEGVPRGLPLGIPDAPDSLPAAGRLSTAPWTVCSVTGPDSTLRSVVLVGAAARDGRPLGDEAVLLRHPDGSLHLVWHRHRHRLRDVNRVLAALAATRQRAVPVAPALLNTLPAGPDLAPLDLPGLGTASDAVSGADIGDVYLVANSGGGRQYVVVDRDGVAGITELQASLLLARTGQGDPEPLTLGRFARLPKLPDLVPTGPTAPPTSPPRLARPEPGAICGQAGDDGGVREVRVGATAPEPGAAARGGGSDGAAGTVADHVVVEPGRGAVVESVAAPGATGGAVSVVTDLGRRHVVASAEVLGVLGYPGVRPVRLPASLVSLVPAGSPLDPEAARQIAG
ncbi:type VII secretion protein EccB [Micromonospora pallida]|uniref:Type VII secretion protein EccB n=1 Tax=Micromonospora pallida TaxID=145854 RepID=A0A1C6SF28_9ACTN|nr:type VII secretion protein EccB [Micromonospora pallida]SCL28100.1 type VII secretion protein EccB [Micromonospora pallida]